MMFDSMKASAARVLQRTAGVLTVLCALAGASEVARAQSLARETHGVTMPPVAEDSRIPSSREPAVLVSEGEALYDAARYKEAAASFERAIQLGAARPHEAAWKVARSYAKLGNRKQALRWAEIAERLGSPSDDDAREVVRALSTREVLRRIT